MTRIGAMRAPDRTRPQGWRDYFVAVSDDRAELVRSAGPVVAGFSATTDALHRLTDAAMQRIFSAGASGSTAFDEGIATLRNWLRDGRDGELFIDDEEAEPLLEDIVGRAGRIQCGGTSIQAAWSWSRLGLHPLLALRNRSARQLSATARGVRIATADGVVRVGLVPAREEEAVPANHVLEFAAGLSAAGIVVKRSSRITVVLTPKRLQLDEEFFQRAPGKVRGGIGLVSGLNGLGAARADVLPRIAQAAESWKEGGARLVHLELADYKRREELAEVMAAVAPQVDSVGMNADELARLVGAGDPALRAAEFAEAHELRRVVVHGDRWAMSVHRLDPRREAVALAAGSLAAANRALTGEPQSSWTVPEAAVFDTDIPAETHLGRWCVSVVSTPYLAFPQSTIGLGDTFVSGDLLVHANTEL